MRTSCPIPTAITGPIGLRSGVRFAAHPQALCVRAAHAVSGFAWWSASWWLLAALCALALLGGCATTLSPGSASIVDAVVVPAIPPPEAPPVACLPVPDMPPPPMARLSSGAVAHKPVPRPVHRARPTRRVDDDDAKPAPEEVPAPPSAPAPLVIVRDLPRGQFRGLLDAEVQRGANVVGRAVDAVADAHGQPRQIVINLAGFMGVGDRKVSLSWDAFRFNTVVGKPLLLLKSNTIDPVASAPASGGSPVPPAGGMNLMDSAVSMRDGAAAGRVVDVLVDADGHARAVVLDVSTSLIHEKLLIAADWSALHVVSKGATVRLETDLDARQLEASPRYEPGQAAHIVTPASGAASGTSSAASATSTAPAPTASPAATARPASAAATASASAVSAARASK
ncbi:MAG: PRC-barrel domain containing protein [Janthinobacterium lividum]